MAQVVGERRGDDPAGRLAVAATAILIAAVWALHLPVLTAGGISHYDEFYTLDRAVSFDRMGDWLTVFSGNAPSFRKPPLQYWMTAGLLQVGMGETAALRLPSMLFALGMLGVTAWLARLLAPERPWAMPLSVALVASSLQFWTLANSAMLDTGAGFFAAAALAAAIAALERPRMWYVVAVLVGLGALQKAPAGLVFVAAGLAGTGIAGRWAEPRWPRVRENPAFRRAAWLALALVLAWPLFQAARHGMDALSESHDRQMFARFAPDAAEGVRGIGDLAGLIVAGEPWLRWPALAAALALPFVLRRPGAAMVAAVVAVYALALTVAGGAVFPRYTLTILPLLLAALAAVVVRLPPAPLAGLVLGAALALLNGGPVRTEALREAARQPDEVAAQVAVLRGVGAEIVPGETLVYCWTRGARRPVPGAVAVYASKGQPMLTAGDAAREGVAGPVRGICPDWEFPDVAPHFRDLAVVREASGYVVFTARGTR